MNPVRSFLPLALATLVLVAGAPLASAAGFPTPANATIPSFVPLVGSDGTRADSAIGHVRVVIRDIANNPIPDAIVIFDFKSSPEIRLAVDPLDPRLLVDCARRTVTTRTGPDGVASATIMGSWACCSGAGGPSQVDISGDWGLLGRRPVCVYDLNGYDGFNLADLSLWSRDYFSATNPARSDYDGDGRVGIADLARWGAAFFGFGSSHMGELCP